MKRFVIILISTLCLISSATSQVRFGKYFRTQTLSLKYTISGDSTHCRADFQKWEVRKGWAGGWNDIDILPSPSDMDVIMSDNATGKIIYHNSYSSLFCEWQMMHDTKPSGDYKECVRMPMPKRAATITLIRNYDSGQKDTVLTIAINPKQHPRPINISPKYQVELLQAAKFFTRINLVFLPEGYKEDEMDKFLAAARKMAEGLFEYEPFSHYYMHFAIKAVLAPSPESGIDIPSEGIERNTLMDFSYDTFDSERYIGTRNHWAISELASNTTWSHAIVLVNDEKYGGGGIYNFYSVFPGGNPYILELFIHEFGHAFANLPDEYAEPDNPIGQKEESDRECIMKALDMRFFCDECNGKIEKVIRRNIGW